MRDYKNIKAYKLADNLVIEVYKLSKRFPKEEVYGLTSQLRRASVSVPSNIAEGASRQHKKDYLQFLYVARGSLSEAEYLLNLSHRLHYLDDNEFNTINDLVKNSAMTLFGLIKSVSNEVK